MSASLAVVARHDGSFALLMRQSGEICALLEQFPEIPLEFRDALFRIADTAGEFVSIDPDPGAATGTVGFVISVRRELTDFLGDLAAALRAGDFDGFVLKHRGSPWLGVATSTVEQAAAVVQSAAADAVTVPSIVPLPASDPSTLPSTGGQ